MGATQFIHDESWRAARLVVRHFAPRLDDAELLDAFSVVREIIAESLQRFPKRCEREHQRIGSKGGHAE
jgi:hypothetical protein